jgi:very-short-patch-repair endonuclease
MDISGVMQRCGGLASRAQLIEATSRAEVDRGLRKGQLVRTGQGRYALPEVEAATTVAHGMNGVLCLTSAALHHGWEVHKVPDKPHVLFPRHRNVPTAWRGRVHLHRGDLEADDIAAGIATSRDLTLTQCLRSLPDVDALVVADSALRHGEQATLRRVMASVRGAGRAKVLRIGSAARAEAANGFESALRGIALTVPGLSVEPQVVISTPTCWARPDLVDRRLHLAIEADSFEWHGSRQALRKDARRYNLLVVNGWLVLRFTWEDVMFDPGYVRDVLVRMVALVDARTEVPPAWPVAA